MHAARCLPSTPARNSGRVGVVRCSCCSSHGGTSRSAAAGAEQRQPEQRAPPLRRAATAGAAASAQLLALAAAAAAAEGGVPVTPVDPSTYVPSPVEPGWQVWFGAIVGVVPFVIGAYEFTKRILIQRRCKVCSGSGLVMKGKYPKKCPECGGMFPWVSWRMFLSATATPGNGGPLLQPKGQTSVFYSVPPPPGADASGQRSSGDGGSGSGGDEAEEGVGSSGGGAGAERSAAAEGSGRGA